MPLSPPPAQERVGVSEEDATHSCGPEERGTVKKIERDMFLEYERIWEK